MLKKPSRKKDAVRDVPADNPKGTLDRLTKLTKRIIKAAKVIALAFPL